LNYSYMVAGAQLPAVGGLFLGRDDAELLNSTERIWASQDQRHTAHGQLRFQPVSRFWTAVGASYGSGLPVELANEDPLVLAAEVGQMVLSRVDLQRGRVMPFFALDLSAGAQLWKRETRALQLQGYIQNLTDRLNVINIANLFSGTALASPRAFSARLRFEF
jgi:outer membrane receptor for Fe3+-dicitrate